MSSKKPKQVKDQYFIPLDEKQDIPLPLSISETEKFELQELESFSLKPFKFKYLKPLLWGLGTLLTSLVVWDLVQFFRMLSEWHLLAAAMVSVIGVITAGSLIKVIWEFSGHRYEYQQVFKLRQQSEQYLNDNHFGKSRQWIESLQSLYEDKPQSALLETVIGNLPDYNNDAEVMIYLADHFYTRLDELALRRITVYSQQTGVLVALSPLALLDMFLALARSLRMIDEVSQIYGLRPSWIGRIYLYKQLFNNMVVAGTTELIADYWADFSSASLSNVVSTRLAQGLGVGLYTARIGIKAMTLCRPLAFEARSEPGVADLLPHIKAFLMTKLGAGEQT